MMIFTAAAATGAIPPAATALPATAAPTMVAVPQDMPIEQIQAIAEAVDPSRVAQYLPPAPVSSPLVEVADIIFDGLGNVAVGIVLIVLIIFVGRLLQAFLLHRSINKAIAAKSDLATGLVDKVNAPMDITLPNLAKSGGSEGVGDVRGALVLIAIGVAMAGFGLIQGGEETVRMACGAALFPLFVGIALLLRRRIVLRERAEELAAARG